MSITRRYRVKLHVSHPTWAAADVIAAFNFPVNYARSVGAQRETKNGELLEGLYKRTDVSFFISDGVADNDNVLLPDLIRASLSGLPLEHTYGISRSGGVCFYFVGIYSQGNLLCDFDAELLSALASHGIGLKLDFYGGPDE